MEKEYKQFAENFARRAGEIIKENFALGMAKEWKSDNTPVTKTDLQINSMLIEEIKKKFPGHSIKGEEESHINENSEYMWVCDPVDGTIPFSHGIPICAFSLALVKNGESILGVVFDPFQKRLFSAQKGGGAFLNGKKIHVSKIDKFKGAAADFEIFDSALYDISALAACLRSRAELKSMSLCSVVYASTLVAAGELAFTIFPHYTAHDAAAVKIIVEEAGGKVTDIYGNEQKYDREINGFVASNGLLHEKLVALTKKMVKKNH